MLAHMQTADLLTTADVAARLGIDRSGVTRRVKSGEIVPAMKLEGIRGAYLFDPEQIDRIVASAQEATR